MIDTSENRLRRKQRIKQRELQMIELIQDNHNLAMSSGIDFCGIDKLKLMHRNLDDTESPATRE